MTVEILKQKHNWNIPTVCPVCGEKLEINDNMTRIYCPNKKCSQKIHQSISKFLSKLKVLNIGPAMIDDFIKAKNITSLFDFLDNKNEMPSILGKNGEKALSNLNKVLKQPIEYYKYLSLFNLSGFETGYSDKKLEKLKEYLTPTLNNVRETLVPLKVAGFSRDSLVELSDLLEEKWTDIKNCEHFFKFSQEEKKQVEGSLTGLSFCFTGKASRPRAELEEEATSRGGTISAVNKNLSYLVCNDVNSTSGKMKKAISLGIEIITEEQFMRLF